MAVKSPVMTEEVFLEVISGVHLSVEEEAELRKHFDLSYDKSKVRLSGFRRREVLIDALGKLPEEYRRLAK